jgi:hypothetical protein
MRAVWKISGDFYGWISNDGSFYNAEGKRKGTVNDNMLYNNEGKYSGELINENFIGYNIDRNFLEGPECYSEEEVYLEPQLSREPIDIIGYTNPE